MKHIYTSVDIGTDSTKVVVTELYKGKLNLLAASSIKSNGIKKGLITDVDEASRTLKSAINEVEEMLGISIKKVLVNVPSYFADFVKVEGEIRVNSENSVIDGRHISKVIETAIKNSNFSKEVVTVTPIDFSVDEQSGISDPKGLMGDILKVRAVVSLVPKKNIYSVISVLSGAGLDVVDITVSGLADYYQVRTPKLDKKIGAIINLGHETTNVSIFNNGKIMNTETIQLGGVNIENDIAYVFGTNIVDARKIKEKFAVCNKRFTNLNDTYELVNNVGDTVKLNQFEVSEVVQSRMSEILKLAKKQITLLTKKDIDYIVITGGLTEIKSFKNLVYEILGKDVIIYLMDEIGIRDNKYTTAMGMIKAFHDKMKVRGKEYSLVSQEDCEILLTPNINNNINRKEKTGVSKIFKGFIRNKEEKYE